MLLLEPIRNLQNLNIVVAKCLVSAKNKKAIMRLINPTKNDVILSPSRVIANINVESQHVYPFENDSAYVYSTMPSPDTAEDAPNTADLSLKIDNSNLQKNKNKS